AQQEDVMSAVQRLRLKAQEANYLKTTKEQTVTVEAAPAGGSPTIVIQSAQPNTVYVPYYDPTVVYSSSGGGWSYPAYPPYYWPPAAGYYGYYPGWVPGRALAAGVAFGVGVAWVNRIGGNVNWGNNNINIGEINIGSGNVSNRTNVRNWEHNSVHRGG